MAENVIDGADGGEATVLAGLQDRLDGAVVVPGDDGWDLARQAWNLLADQRPTAVVQARDADDVVTAVRFAAEHDLGVTAQATGHGATGLASLADTLLVRTDALRDVAVDPATRRARVGAGVTWDEVAAAAAPHGLAGLAGSAGDVGVVGYTLGGGIGWLARPFGLASNAVTAIELVTADGQQRRVDADHDPELFWGLRGGGGGFGIVTALEFDLFPVPELTAGALFFPVERTAEVLHAWRDWTATVPQELTSVGRVMRFPPMPELPEPLRGQSFAIIELAHLADLEATEELVAGLRELGPVMDTIAEIEPPALAGLHMDPPEPAPGLSSHGLLTDGGADLVDALVEVAGPDSGCTLLSVELRHLGGALGRVPDEHGALACLEADFALFAVTIADPTALEPAREELARVVEATGPWDAGTAYPNFVEEPGDDRPLFDLATQQRLQALKGTWDPTGRVVATHPVPLPGS